MNQEFLKKYGLWIALGLVAVYLLFQRGKAQTAARPGVDPELAREELRQRGASAERASRSALEEVRLAAQLEAERIRQETERIRLGLQRQGIEASAAAARAAQQAGLLNSIIGALSKLLGGASAGKSQPSIPGGTPSTFPRTSASTAPGTTIPAPSGIGPLLFESSFQPEYPTPNLSAVFEAPDLSFDSGYSFANQGFYEATSQEEFDYFNSLDGGGAGELTGVYPSDIYEAESQQEFDYFNQLEPGYDSYLGGGGGGGFTEVDFATYDFYSE